jgi:hypothetical protein
MIESEAFFYRKLGQSTANLNLRCFIYLLLLLLLFIIYLIFIYLFLFISLRPGARYSQRSTICGPQARQLVGSSCGTVTGLPWEYHQSGRPVKKCSMHLICNYYVSVCPTLIVDLFSRRSWNFLT